MNSHKRFEGKLKKFKNWPSFCQTRIFRDWNESPSLATKTLKEKILKKISSVFRDWKVYPQGSRELSRENLCVTLATRPFTRKQFAKINTWACGWILRLGWPATESPKQDNTVFEIFLVFVKTKYFPKTLKTLKNLFVFESTKIEHVKTHFNKYNHTNEYDIHWI